MRSFVSFSLIAALLGTAAHAGDIRAVATVDHLGLTDAARGGRRVPMRVHYPKGEGRHPLVVYSHGGGGNIEAHAEEAAYLAARGYIVVCVEHVRSNTDAVRAHSRTASGGLKARLNTALVRITRDPLAVLERPRDIRFAIDRAVAWDAAAGPLKGRVDTSKIAVAGHSFGAYTTMVACGARPILDHLDHAGGERRKGLAWDLSDDRVTCGIAMSPQGLGTSRFGAGSYATIDRPLLCFSGTKDTQLSADGQTLPATRRLEGFRLFPAGGHRLLWLDGADHLSFAFNAKSHLFPSPARADTRRFVLAFSLAFCDLNLKGDAAADARLTQAAADKLVGKVVTRVTLHTR